MEKDVAAFGRTMQVAFELLKGIDTPRALAISMLADAYLIDSYEPILFDEQRKALGFKINAYDQFCVDRFRDDYQATVLLSKLPPKDPDASDLHDAAIEAFEGSESRSAFLNCLWINDSQVESRFAHHGHQATLENFRKEIRRVLGRCPSLRRLSDKGEWTSGASVGLSRKWASPALKAEMGLTVTYPLAKALYQVGELSPLVNCVDAWYLVPGNLVDTVLKNIVTNRTIGKEPDINAFFQRALGGEIRERLRGEGINLNDQTLNQRACLRAHLDESATIDVKDASNSTLSFMVRSCFPSDWSDMLELLRSPHGSFGTRKETFDHKATWFEYQMLSSMGNGYTFELESVVFYCACLACGVADYDIYIYGDDIIVPQVHVKKVTAFLALLGFETNLEKSFVSGTFFESCGVFAFHGVDVTPLKIKDLLYENENSIVLANKIRWYSHCCCNNDGCDRRFLPAWRLCLSGISASVRKRCRGPINSGLTIHSNINEATCVKYSRRRGSLMTSQLVPRVRSHFEADWASLLSYRLFELFSGRGEGRFYKNQLKPVDSGRYIQAPLSIEGNWYNFGPWVTRAR